MEVLTPIARMRLSAELVGSLKQQSAIPETDPLRALKRAKLSSSIAATLKALGVDTGAAKREQDAFALEGGPDIPAKPRVVTAHLYEFDDTRKHGQRKRDNAEAMALLKKIKAGEAADLTDAQKQILARYSGTGGNLVGENGKRGSAYEYYTPKPIAAGMWDMLKELGFSGGKVLDPCSGTGIFGATAPANAAIDAVELNETSGEVNKLVNSGPGHNVTVSPFEAVASRTPDEAYDAIITNVPFGSVHDRGSNRKIDPRYQNESLETYFILRTLEKLKPGGLAAYIVPPRVVTAKGGREEKLRIEVSYVAEFMGAYRLPNSVFGTADADTITDVIVFRKFSRPALQKIEELREQNPALLVSANVMWQEFVTGMYFQGEGKKYVLGQFQAKDPNKFRDVDRVISDASVPNIAKLLRKFPGSRIDWKALEEAETAPILYNEGDTITLAGQTLKMTDGAWVDVGQAESDSRYDGIGEIVGTATLAVSNKVDWPTASSYVEYLSGKSLDLDIPTWLRMAARDINRLDEGDRPKYWGALSAGIAAVEVSRAHAEITGFNYLEEYPVLSEALQAASVAAKKSPASFSRDSKAALQKVGIVYDRKAGFSDLWTGKVKADVTDGQVLTEDAQVEAVKYQSQGTSVEIDVLKGIYGEKFDPMTSDDWCIDAEGKTAKKADDYYVGNLADFHAKIDAEIAKASGPVKDKLLRQRAQAAERVSVLDPESLSFNLFTPFVTIEEKAEFLRRFMHPAFVVAYDKEDGKPIIVCDIGEVKTERDRQYKRIAEYMKVGGNLTTRTIGKKDDPELDAMRRKMLREMVAQANAQFDQWTKANPVIMERLRTTANDPQNLYFNEVDDTSPLKIDGISDGLKLHGYQNAFVRKMARQFGGGNAFDVGLGKTYSALASIQHVQSIGVKKKTMIVVPNSVLSNWRREAGRAYATMDDCLFIGLTIDKNGKARVNSSDYARDFNLILTNKHRKIFCTLEAFKTIPMKDETIDAYSAYMQRVDPSFEETNKNSESERAKSKLAEATEGTGEKSSSIPYFEDMDIDSIVLDEGHMYKNGKLNVEFKSAKFLSKPDKSERGTDVQVKAWFVRNQSSIGDGVLVLTATPITNSPLEIYTMLCLTAGERKVHAMMHGVAGADNFMNAVCVIEDDEEMSVDGTMQPYRVFKGLRNVNLLRSALSSVYTIKTAADVKGDGDDLKLPDSPHNKTAVQLDSEARSTLDQYKKAYRAARFVTGAASKNAAPPTDDEIAAMNAVSEKFGEPIDLIAHPFNLINKMSLLIADPELDMRATFYSFNPAQEDAAKKTVADFNKLDLTEERALPGPYTDQSSVGSPKTKKNDDDVKIVFPIKVRAKIEGNRIIVDSMEYKTQVKFEKVAEKSGLDLDCSIPPKLAALLENCRKEEASPRNPTGRVKQLVFCDVLPMHTKIKRLLNKRLGVLASAISIVSGQSIKNPEQLQDVQDGFNAEGEDNKYRYVVANEKAEVGINLQKGTQAIHHLTIGWTPDSQHQRNGRGVRQGNTVSRVNVYHYDADGTFDEYKRTLTNKKSDWISAVMDKQGGNEVSVAGGLTNEQYNELIESMGDEAAIRSIRERAEFEEKRKNAETARARQIINLKTAKSLGEFARDYPNAEAWIAKELMRAYDLQVGLKALRFRLEDSTAKPETQIKLQSRIAEMEARIAGMRRDIEASAELSQSEYSYADRKSVSKAVSIDEVFKEGERYGRTPAKKREYLEGAVKRAVTAKPDTVLVQDYESEKAAANAMRDEAFKDFEKIAKVGGLPIEALSAFKSDDAIIIDGKLFYKGMFARDRTGVLGCLADKTTIRAYKNGVAAQRNVTDALSGGAWTFIYHGSPEYAEALQEAAALDDQVETVDDNNRDALYGSMNPEVNQYRKRKSMVKYQSGSAELPAPYFKYPVYDGFNGMSDALKSIAVKQREIIAGWTPAESQWQRTTFTCSSEVDIITGSYRRSGALDLAEYAKAAGLRVSLRDLALVEADNEDADFYAYRNSIMLALRKIADWPEDPEPMYATAQTLEDVEFISKQIIADALPFIETDGLETTMLPNNCRDAANTRFAAISRAQRAQENQAVETGSGMVGGVTPNAKGLIGITGETKPNKETIKECAKQAGGYARWNGDAGRWDVPAATWGIILKDYPEVAKVLQVVPA